MIEKENAYGQLRTWFDECAGKRKNWFENAEKAYKFAAGDQYTDAEKAELEKKQRPVVVFNKIGPILDAVAGTEVTNRQEVTYLPRGVEDSGVSELITKAVKWFRYGAGSEDEESDAFRDMCICGEGWTDTGLDYDDNQGGDLRDDRVSPMEMYPDVFSKKGNYLDAKKLFRAKSMSLSEAVDLFPNARPEDLNAPWAEWGQDYQKNDKSWPDRAYDGEGKLQYDSQVTIVEAQWWERDVYWLVTINGSTQEFTPEEYESLQERFEETEIVIHAEKHDRKIWRRAFLGGKILAEPPLPTESFTYIAMTGKCDEVNGWYYGLVWPMIDPQCWANKFMSQMMFILNSNAKGGIIAEEDAVDDIRELENSWAQSDSVTMVAPGSVSGGKIQVKNPPNFPPDLRFLLGYSDDNITSTSGVSLEMLSMANRDQPGVLEYQRREQGVSNLSYLFDALRQYRKAKGKLTMEIVRRYLSDDRLVRIVGDDGLARYIPMMRLPQTAEYDVIVDSAPSSPNEKHKVWAMLRELMPMIQTMQLPQQVAQQMLNIAIQYSPLPDAISNELSKAARQASSPDPRLQQAQAALQQAQQVNELLTQQLQALVSDRSLSEAKLMLDASKAAGSQKVNEFKAETDRAKALLPNPSPALQAQTTRQTMATGDIAPPYRAVPAPGGFPATL